MNKEFDIGFDEASLNKFKSAFKKYPGKVKQASKEIIAMATKAGERGVVNAVRSGPTKAIKSGNLFRLIASGFTIAGRGLEGVVKSQAHYSLYVHEGTRYMRARPYMDVGLDNVENEIITRARRILNQAI